MSERDDEMELAAEKWKDAIAPVLQTEYHRGQHANSFRAGWKAASERKDGLLVALDLKEERIQSLQSKLATALESLSRIQVRIDESNHHPSDLKAISELAREALAKIKGDAK